VIYCVAAMLTFGAQRVHVLISYAFLAVAVPQVVAVKQLHDIGERQKELFLKVRNVPTSRTQESKTKTKTFGYHPGPCQLPATFGTATDGCSESLPPD
jgi:hypothetical protein